MSGERNRQFDFGFVNIVMPIKDQSFVDLQGAGGYINLAFKRQMRAGNTNFGVISMRAMGFN